MSIVPKFLLTFFSGGLVRPIWERVSALYLNFLNDNYIVSGTPSTLSSYVTHSRSGNATMVDSDGLIKWAPHNLCLRSEDLTTSWYFNNATRTANATTAPDGTVTADKLVDNSGGGTNVVFAFQAIAVSAGAKYTASVFLKADPDGLEFAALRANDYDGGTYGQQYFGLSGAGSLGTVVGTLDDSGITAYPNGWYRCSITWTQGASDPTFSFIIYVASSISSATVNLDGTSSIFVWGAHVYRSDLGGMVDNPDRGDSYVPTTSSAVYLPRRNHYAYNGGQWVNEGLLTESESRQNLVQESEDFSGYTLTNLASIAVSATPLAPDGNQTALRLLDNSSTSLKALSKSTYTVSVVSGDRVTISAYFQKGTLSYGVIYAVTGSGTPFGASPGSLPVDRAACFDLDNGNVGEVGSLLSDGRVENVGNGWYRCSVTVIAGGTGTFYPAFGLTNADDGDVTYTSAGTGTVYLWGAQMEVGATPSSYMPTSGATFTRAADTLTIPAANLPWPTPQVIGSELVTNGTFDTDTTGWSGVNSTLSVVSQKLRVTGDGVNSFPRATQSISTTIGSVYSVSGSFSVITDGSGTEIQKSDDSVSFTNGKSSGSGVGGVIEDFIFVATATTTYIWLKSNATTSVIDWDNISVKEIDPLSVSIQMDGRMTYADEGDNAEIVYLNWETGNDQISYRLRTDGTRTGAVQILQRASAVLDTVETTSGTVYSPDILVPYNIASRHGSTFLNGAVDGTALTANTTPTALPDLSSTDLDLAHDYMGTIRTFRMWDADLTDEGIAYVSERSEEPTISLSFNRSESSFTVSDWLP